MRRHLLLYKTGETDPRLIDDIGDYERWFSRVLGPGFTLELHRAFEAPRHRLSGYDGLIITGSPRSLVEPEPWMDDSAAFVLQAADAGVPVLGVCFGHQLLGHAWGGRVRKNPNGWEVGTAWVELTDEGRRDPLFAELPERLQVNQSHRDEVHALGPDVRQLATGGHTAVQALAVCEHVRGVQFHPEMSGAIIRRILVNRREILSDDFRARGRSDTIDELIAQADDTPNSERVLQNFARAFVRRA
jgi:GMP synthase (glutamine-hydrolysing)